MINADRDRLLDMLAALPATTPAVEATERLRARCHTALVQSQPTQTKPHWPWLVLAMSLLYLAAAMAQALMVVRLT